MTKAIRLSAINKYPVTVLCATIATDYTADIPLEAVLHLVVQDLSSIGVFAPQGLSVSCITDFICRTENGETPYQPKEKTIAEWLATKKDKVHILGLQDMSINPRTNTWIVSCLLLPSTNIRYIFCGI